MSSRTINAAAPKPSVHNRAMASRISPAVGERPDRLPPPSVWNWATTVWNRPPVSNTTTRETAMVRGQPTGTPSRRRMTLANVTVTPARRMTARTMRTSMVTQDPSGLNCSRN